MSLTERRYIIAIIDEARSSGARLAEACRTVEIDASTYRRWQHCGSVKVDQRSITRRPAPVNKLSKQERELILLTCDLPEFKSLPPSQIVPSLADTGIYLASESTFYRVLHDALRQHDRGRARARQKRSKPDEFVATGPNQCWCWDVTYLKSPTRGMFYYLYLMIDVFSRKVTAWEVHETESGELASDLMRRGVLAEGCAGELVRLHADNGSIQKSSTLRATLEWLGVEPSYSRPRVSNDNAYPESFFRTTKYRPDFPEDGFANLGEARKWCSRFIRWYNEEHKHSALKFVTPGERHRSEDVAILAKREEVYREAKAAKPERWSGKARNWSRPGPVKLNPDKPLEKLKTVA